MNNLKGVTYFSVLIGCKKSTIYSLVRSGKIPHRRIGGRLIRFSDDDIESFLGSVKVEKEVIL